MLRPGSSCQLAGEAGGAGWQGGQEPPGPQALHARPLRRDWPPARPRPPLGGPDSEAGLRGQLPRDTSRHSPRVRPQTCPTPPCNQGWSHKRPLGCRVLVSALPWL